jgi:hypothetical protein
MLDFSTPPFGKPIRLKNSLRKKSKTPIEPGKPDPNCCNELGANAMVSQFLNMKSNYRDKLQQMTGSDHHAVRYYCNNDCAFIFDVKHMKALIKAIEDKHNRAQGGCVVLYMGLRKSSREDKNNQQKNCSFGRPTIIALPYIITENDTIKHVQVKKEHIEGIFETEDLEPPYDGYEHPGNGNSGESFSKATAESEAQKEFTVVAPGGEDDDNDWTICEEFPVKKDQWL